MDLDAGTLIVGFIVSGIGFVLFSYGRKMQRIPHVVFGLVMMVYPYVTRNSLPLTAGIGVVLCALLYLATRAGY